MLANAAHCNYMQCNIQSQLQIIMADNSAVSHVLKWVSKCMPTCLAEINAEYKIAKASPMCCKIEQWCLINRTFVTLDSLCYSCINITCLKRTINYTIAVATLIGTIVLENNQLYYSCSNSDRHHCLREQSTIL